MPAARRGGVRIFYEEVGAGPTVLLHTGGGGDGQMWRAAGYLAALSGYRTLVMDHRGHGRSDCPSDPAAHQLAEYVADVVAVLDAAGVDRAALVGYSFGARVAYGVASRHPHRIAAVIGLGTLDPFEPDPAGDAAWAREVRAQGMPAAMQAIAAAEPEPAPGWLLDNLSATDGEMFALLLEGLGTAPSVWDELPAITSPVLVMCGELEEAGAGERARAAVSRLSDGRAVVFPDLAHLQLFWRTDRTLPHLVDFLRGAISGPQ